MSGSDDGSLIGYARSLLAELDSAVADLAAARAERAEAQAKIRAVETLHCWTNEDGKRFVYADDLAVALRIPGALSGPVAEPTDVGARPGTSNVHPQDLGRPEGEGR